MTSRKRTAADRHDTWDAEWEDRLARHVRCSGFASVWDYVRRRPGQSYAELAEALAASGDFGVAPIQVERLQVRDTPAAELRDSIRDSLVRHLRGAFKSVGWRQGPYWESTAMGALGSWSAMWSERVDLGVQKRRLFELGVPEGWLPADDRDPVLLELLPPSA
jgi:hypothetical protein